MTETDAPTTGPARIGDDDAFYRPLGAGRYLATEHCGGPWDPTLQHAGPPEALIARELRLQADRPETPLARLTFELLGPLPVGEVQIDVQVARRGARVQLLEATLHAGGRAAIRARAWQVARTEVDPVAADARPPALPATSTPPVPPWDASGYIRAMDWRFTGGGFDTPGRGAAWATPRLPLVAGEPLGGWDRLLLLADSANGVSVTLDIRTWFSIPPETTLHLLREPAGAWVHLDATTTIAAGGPGVSRGVLSDEDGVLGFVTQSLLVSPR